MSIVIAIDKRESTNIAALMKIFFMWEKRNQGPKPAVMFPPRNKTINQNQDPRDKRCPDTRDLKDFKSKELGKVEEGSLFQSSPAVYMND